MIMSADQYPAMVWPMFLYCLVEFRTFPTSNFSNPFSPSFLNLTLLKPSPSQLAACFCYTLYVCFCYTLYVRNSKSLKLEKFEVGKDRSRPCEYHYKIYVDFQKHLPMMQILRLFYMKRYRHVYISDKKPCLSFQKQL